MNKFAFIDAELSADGKLIVLVAHGEEWQMQNTALVLTELTPLASQSQKTLGREGGMTLPLSWAAVVQLSSTFAGGWRTGPALTEWIAAELARREYQEPKLFVEPPRGYVPRSYQVEGAALIRELGSGLLWDEPGTGKTVTAVLGLVERAAQRHPTLPVLVVAPSSVVDTWVDHFRAWAPFWRVTAWRGSPKKRMALLHTSDIYVASYGVVRQDAQDMDPRHNPLIALRPNALVADEAHKIKDQGAEQSRAVRRIAQKSQLFLGLTGTPITHNPGDIWPQLYCVSPNANPSRERWIKRYCHHVQKDYSVEALGFNHREDEYRLTIKGQSRRVAKADVLHELPDKVYSVRHVELPPQWRKVYEQMERDMLAELPDGGQLSVMGVLAKLTRLQQLAAAAADVTVTTSIEPDLITGLPIEKEHTQVHLKFPSWKVDEMIEVMNERPGRKVVVFSPSRQLVMLAAQKAAATGRAVGHIVGGQTARERTANVDAFQAGKLDAVFVTTGAGGVGLTLTAGSVACFLNRPFSLVESTQAEDRIHRIGAEIHDSVEIIDIVAKNTIETRVRQIIKQRAGQLSDFVRDPRIVAEILGGASVTNIRKAG